MTFPPFTAGMAAGMINGHAWSFQSGSAHIIRKGHRHFAMVRLWQGEFADPCNELTGSPRQVRLMAPYKVSSWQVTPEDPFNPEFSIFFADEAVDFIALTSMMKADQGSLAFHNIGNGLLEGRFGGSYANKKVAYTHVEGGFRVPLCTNQISFRDNF